MSPCYFQGKVLLSLHTLFGVSLFSKEIPIPRQAVQAFIAPIIKWREGLELRISQR
jgi:hypothetical protein